MGKIKNHLEFIKNILSSRNYFLTFLITSIIVFSTLAVLSLKTVANQKFSIFVLMSGTNYVFFDFLLAVLISLLSGIFVVLFIKKFNLVRKTSGVGILGALGVTIGLFAAGCPTCGAFLFSLIGFPLALTYIPLRGIGLKIISAIFLLLSNYFLVQGMLSCKIKRRRILKK